MVGVMGLTGPPVRFSVDSARFVVMAVGCIFAAAGFDELIGGWGVGALQVSVALFFLGFGIFAVIRGFLSATVIVAPRAITLRSAYRTRIIPTTEVSGTAVEVGNTGFNGWGRQYLVVTKTDGTVIRFKELNAKVPEVPGVQTVVERCVAAINEVVSPPPQASEP